MRNILSVVGEKKEEEKKLPRRVRDIFREKVRLALNLVGREKEQEQCGESECFGAAMINSIIWGNKNEERDSMIKEDGESM